jgi:acyl-CoA hydrolase
VVVSLGLPPSPSSAAAVADALVEALPADCDIVVPIANGEPISLLDELEARADRLQGVRVHQMHALRDRPYLHGAHRGRLEHVSWFLSPVTRPAFAAGGCQFVPANFSEVPRLLRQRAPVVVLASASPPDRHGYFSLGVCADYAAALIGRVPFVLEVNPRMPRTYGANRLHARDVAAWYEAEHPLVEIDPAPVGEIDDRIAQLVAERVPDGACLQLGIGSIPSAVASRLAGHRDLSIHTELFSDPMVDLIEAGVVTGINKRRYRGRAVATFALGSHRLYDFCDQNDVVLFLAVDEVNDPRLIGREPNFVSINATLQVDLFGQCASESLGTRYYSGSGGQADFARGAQYSEGGRGYVVLRSTAGDGSISRITPVLSPGAVVTTMKNTVDHVVTEYGVAELRGKTIEQRAEALIGVAHPDHRDLLRKVAVESGVLDCGRS